MIKKILSFIMLVGSLQASVEVLPGSDKKTDVIQNNKIYPTFKERQVLLNDAFEKMSLAGIKVECSLKSWAKKTYCFNAESLDAFVKKSYEFANQRSLRKGSTGSIVIKNKDMKKAFKYVMKAYNITALRSSLTRAERALLITAGTVGGLVGLSWVLMGIFGIVMVATGSLF